MIRPIATLVCLVALCGSLVSRVDAAELPVDSVLARHASPAALRSALLAYAEERSATDPTASGEALLFAGESWFREGARDSAILAWERAWARRRGAAEGDALIEARLTRLGPEDLDRAHALIQARLDQAQHVSEYEMDTARGRLAWWHALSGRPDSAVALYKRSERRLVDLGGPMEWTWRWRIAQAIAPSSEPGTSSNYAIPLAARSFATDRKVLELISSAFPSGIKSAMALIRTEMNVLVEDRNLLIKGMGGREVSFRAADGMNISAIVLAPPGKRRFRAAVGLVNADEPFEAWDSLATRLRGAGMAVILVEARGSGRSRTQDVPSPEAWRGHEAALERLVAEDLCLAIRALSQAASVDTSRVLLVAGLQGASVATEAAARDPRFHALLLSSPRPHPVDHGRAIANVAKRNLPVFITNAASDVYPYAISVSDLLLHASDERASRIWDTAHPGPGVRVFGRDREAFPRFLRWMEETWARPAQRAGARPTRSPRG